MSPARQTLAVPFALAATALACSPLQAADNGDTTQLGDITVTATRVEKDLSKVPAAVSVVDQEQVQYAQQQIGIDESLVTVPGVFMQNRYNFAQDLRRKLPLGSF